MFRWDLGKIDSIGRFLLYLGSGRDYEYPIFPGNTPFVKATLKAARMPGTKGIVENANQTVKDLSDVRRKRFPVKKKRDFAPTQSFRSEIRISRINQACTCTFLLRDWVGNTPTPECRKGRTSRKTRPPVGRRSFIFYLLGKRSIAGILNMVSSAGPP